MPHSRWARHAQFNMHKSPTHSGALTGWGWTAKPVGNRAPSYRALARSSCRAERLQVDIRSLGSRWSRGTLPDRRRCHQPQHICICISTSTSASGRKKCYPINARPIPLQNATKSSRHRPVAMPGVAYSVCIVYLKSLLLLLLGSLVWATRLPGV